LTLFSELLRARGDTVLTYKNKIISIFHQTIHITNKSSYKAIAHAANHLLESLSHTYPLDYRLTVENINGPFVKFLPIRVRCSFAFPSSL
jgi:hypothetical protein